MLFGGDVSPGLSRWQVRGFERSAFGSFASSMFLESAGTVFWYPVHLERQFPLEPLKMKWKKDEISMILTAIALKRGRKPMQARFTSLALAMALLGALLVLPGSAVAQISP